MGQPNSPIVSKLGYSMHWGTSGLGKINFTKKLNEDIFINMFLPLFFKKTYLNTPALKAFLIEVLKKKSKQKMIFSCYFCSKVWVLRYQTWILIAFYLYNPIRKKTAKSLTSQTSVVSFVRLTQKAATTTFISNVNNAYAIF